MKKNEYPGKFIVFEGLDGSGQSTQAGLLKKFVENRHLKVILTKEPTADSEAGKSARLILQGKKQSAPQELQNLFAQDRAVHLAEIIIPHLRKGYVVISDRYFLSSLAFGAADGADLDALIDLNENKLNPDLIKPDLTIFLKVKPEVAVSRIQARGGTRERFEKEKKLKKVLSYYENLICTRYSETCILNGEKPIQDISEEIQNIFEIMLQSGWSHTLR